MPTVTFIIGLPGSGKTHLAHRLKKINEAFRPCVIYDDLKKTELDALEEAVKQGKDVILVDPWLCYPSTREIACKRIEEWGATIDEIFFENDPEAALRNVRHRNDGRHVESFIKQTTKHYTIPDGTIKAKIWNPKRKQNHELHSHGSLVQRSLEPSRIHRYLF